LNINSFVIDTTVPTVSSISTTADNQSSVLITDNFTVTFSKAIEPSYVTTSTSDTNCAGSIRVSSDNFSTCVKMSSEPVSSNDNKTFTLDPYDNLTFGSTYLTRVTTGVKDTAGNALSSQYETTNGFTTTESFSISSSASDNASVAFGQTYQYQLNTGGAYSGTITYSLSNEPDNMTISSSGLVEWTPSKNSDIGTHDNITITLTTASGYVLTETYDLAVTGTCVSGNVMSIWSGDQRSSTDSSKFLGNITAYTDNSSSPKTASQNYDYRSSSVNLTHGPEATVNDGAVFFYNRYTDNDTLYLFYFFGMDVGGSSNKVSIDVFVSNNASQDSNPVDDDGGETDLESQSQSATTGLWTSSYTGRYAYGANSDGAVIGPFSNTDNQTLLDNGTTFKIFVDLSGTSSLRTSATPGRSTALTLGDLDSMKYYSKDNSTVSLGNQDNFTIGYKTRITCD
jgi:hypothetical protein